MVLKVYINDIFEDKSISVSGIKNFCSLSEYLLKIDTKIYYMSNNNIYNIYKCITSDDVGLRKRFMDIFENKRGHVNTICSQDNMHCDETDISVYYFDPDQHISIKKKSSIGEFISNKIVDSENFYCFILNFENSLFNGSTGTKVYENYLEQTEITFVKNEDEIESACKYIYPENSSNKPTVEQTILRDTSKFRHHKQNIYSYDKYFVCKDTLHKGKGAHLEVYDSLGDPLGKTSIHKFELIKFTKDEKKDRKSLNI